MKIIRTPLAGLFEIRKNPTGDSRGRFTRLFCERELAPIRPRLHFCQVNLSETRERGTLRGMHYQKPPVAEAKLIQCLRGRVFDVALDVRAGSPTFLQWHAVELAEDNDTAVFIPEGFAHGFQALTDEAHLLYMHTNFWSADHEAGVRSDEPRAGIRWPLPSMNVSARDAGFARLDDTFAGVSA